MPDKLSQRDLTTIRDLSTVIFDTLLLDGSFEDITACFDRLLPEVKAELRKREGELE